MNTAKCCKNIASKEADAASEARSFRRSWRPSGGVLRGRARGALPRPAVLAARRTGLALAALSALSSACASALGSAPGAPAMEVGVDVRNSLEIQIGVHLDGRVLGYVGPFDRGCIYVPVPNREGILRFTTTGGVNPREIAHTARTAFHTQPSWTVFVRGASIAPVPVAPGGECAPRSAVRLPAVSRP